MPSPYQQYITLTFLSMEALGQFQKLASLRNFHFDTRDRTHRAQLTEKQMELAVISKSYGAAFAKNWLKRFVFVYFR